MQIVFESHDPGGTQLRNIAEQRLRFVMRRAAFLVPRARIRLSDLNGPRGDIDKRCQLELKLERGDPIIVFATAKDCRHAFELVLARAARTLARSWQKSRRFGRTSAVRRTAAFDEPTAAAV